MKGYVPSLFVTASLSIALGALVIYQKSTFGLEQHTFHQVSSSQWSVNDAKTGLPGGRVGAGSR